NQSTEMHSLVIALHQRTLFSSKASIKKLLLQLGPVRAMVTGSATWRYHFVKMFQHQRKQTRKQACSCQSRKGRNSLVPGANRFQRSGFARNRIWLSHKSLHKSDIKK